MCAMDVISKIGHLNSQKLSFPSEYRFQCIDWASHFIYKITSQFRCLSEVNFLTDFIIWIWKLIKNVNEDVVLSINKKIEIEITFVRFRNISRRLLNLTMTRRRRFDNEWNLKIVFRNFELWNSNDKVKKRYTGDKKIITSSIILGKLSKFLR